jgi:signal transduction histidine kinase
MIVIKELETKRRLEDMEMSLKERDSKIKKLESVGERKSEFIYNISHELKTPLTNIKGFSSLLYNGNAGELTKSEKDYVSTIMEESDRLMLIIQQVLDAAKLEADKVKLDFKDFDLKTIYNNPTIKSLEESALNKGLEFKWEADKSLPNVSCDPNRLIQVFVNLIGNAVKFTDKGGITVHMFLKTKRAVECDVIDTGIGISEDDRKKLFKKDACKAGWRRNRAWSVDN